MIPGLGNSCWGQAGRYHSASWTVLRINGRWGPSGPLVLALGSLGRKHPLPQPREPRGPQNPHGCWCLQEPAGN